MFYVFSMYTNKLLNALNENTKLHLDIWTRDHLFQSGNKKWVANIVPVELLTRSVKDAINSLMTLSEGGIFYET